MHSYRADAFVQSIGTIRVVQNSVFGALSYSQSNFVETRVEVYKWHLNESSYEKCYKFGERVLRVNNSFSAVAILGK